MVECFSHSSLFPFSPSPCPLQLQFRKGQGSQVPEAGRKNQVEDPPLAGYPPIIVPYGNEVECVLE